MWREVAVFSLIAGFWFGMAGESTARPFGRLRGQSVTGNGYQAGTVQQVGSFGGLWTAQQAANYQASIGRMGHFGNPSGGWEGVGMGTSPQAAIQNCCFYGRRPLRDSGVAQGPGGMWFACCRYN